MKLVRIISAAVLGLMIATGAHAADTAVDYERVELTDPAARAIWGDYIDSYEITDPVWNSVFVAKMRTPEGDELLLSTMTTPIGCGDLDCPVRIVRNGKMVYQNSECRYMERHLLNPSMNTVFYCDDAVPTVAETKE